jgi:hypothetical protein
MCGVSGVELWAKNGTKQTVSYTSSGVLDVRPTSWQSHYESCHYLLDFYSNSQRENSSIGIVITAMDDTAVYLFEGNREFPVNLVRSGAPAKKNKLYRASKGSNLLVVS